MPKSTGYLKGFFKKNRLAIIFLLLLCAAAVVFTVVSFRRSESEKRRRGAIEPFIEEYSEKYQLDKELVYAVIECESGFDTHAVSKAGACGLMQLMPKTFWWITDTEDGELDIFDPETNIAAGCKYLKYLFGRFDNLETILAAYNAGEGNVSEWLRNPEYSDDGKSLKIIPYPETSIYVQKVITIYSE